MRVESSAVAPFDAATLAEVMPFGVEREVDAGEVLYRAGDNASPFVVVLDGEADVFLGPEGSEVVVATRGARGFLGELNLLTGQRPYVSARMKTAGRVLVVQPDDFRRLMSTKPDISDIIFRAFVARRALLRSGDGAAAIQIIGSRFSPEAMALRAFAGRARLPHTWIDVEDLEDPPVFLASLGAHRGDVPLVLTPTARLRHTTPGELSQYLGLTYRPAPGYL